MSQTYRFKSLQISKSEESQVSPDDEKLTVYTVGETKTIDFILKDGTRQNFNYNHFITSWLGIEDNLNIIKIFFSTHLVTIKGYCLDDLYNHLLEHAIKSIKEHDERYISMAEETDVFVTEIDIQWKKDKVDLD